MSKKLTTQEMLAVIHYEVLKFIKANPNMEFIQPLRRVGVTFTPEQEALIRSFADKGDI